MIATEAHRDAFEAKFADAGVDVAAALARRARSSGSTRPRPWPAFMRDGDVDRDAFFDRLGPIMGTAAATGRPVRAFGEMVALLWEAGDVLAAIDLETAWNELAAQVPFSLYCAYRTDSVAGTRRPTRSSRSAACTRPS